MDYAVYILFSEKLNRYYCGHTNDVEKRLDTHNSGGKKYTTKGMPWVLIKVYHCSSRSEAVRLERKVKKRGIQRYLDEN
ncbi:GIY-YIG nuclease family protein [Hyunsoonleella sp. SJ7]|uniref:GIY-YIG nuclease family protein n=1 Tax=Hyunsoonleella aquatilis TaxID=2762758 RepID=A0A923KJN3_9FLAO|nr:GIY-YIG nuclease family protein [Hyunsoonleella aquatilis]MBC3757597.1 GIY-YIG nuclease family protein [Hyunsoonleella aquatilis]